MFLIVQEFSQNNLDTSEWKIDHDFILPQTYYHFCAEIMFYCDGLELSHDSDAAVLSIGLGGGVLNGFLHQNFPKMNITAVEISAQMARVASKWFDLQLDDRHSLIITDGVKFVKEQAEKAVLKQKTMMQQQFKDW
ncbi:hypothetical protein ANCCAN_23025 [Ancylostoma caninum]|uniref:Methyltransferase type 11 domain-containing protein n=1 Tax=Ancylostoma caninum TaxID=29170 RepID=A0A368FG43_ANCCA|nr:hypothetical protein ANCCAN_23025 [Ancylostoma caninum]